MGLTLPVLPTEYLPFSTHGPTFHLLTVMKMNVPVAHGMGTASVDQFILTGTYTDSHGGRSCPLSESFELLILDPVTRMNVAHQVRRSLVDQFKC